MEYTKIDSHVQSNLQSYIVKYGIEKIIDALSAANATVLLVGGAVRDLLLGLPLKDLDIEVHGIAYTDLQKILSQFGSVNEFGKAYGVVRIIGIDVDWSLPRTDMQGRKPHVDVNPQMKIEEAFRRRDVTINAMGINLVTFELIDPFGGLHDLRKSVLRAIDNTKFIEDPLRFYRVMQFIARFDFNPTKELNTLCKTMNISDVSKERIEQEFRKTFLLSQSPSCAFRWLNEIGRLKEILPEVAALRGVIQDPKWHPEGDVFEHTMQALDAAARQEYKTDEQKLCIMYAALCHDLGKVSTTEKQDDGSITSYGHDEVGVGLTRKLLKRIMNNKEYIDRISKLVRFHMQPLLLVKQNATLSAYKRLANKLAPDVTMYMLAQLARADTQGRNPKGYEPLNVADSKIDIFLQQAAQAQVTTSKEEPVLHGRDIMHIIEPGEKMGEFLKEAYEIQIEEEIRDKKELIKRVQKNLS